MQVRARLHFLRETLCEQVAGVLDTRAEVPRVKGRWRGIWDKAHAFFSRRGSADMEREALQATLLDLHADVLTQIETEVGKDRNLSCAGCVGSRWSGSCRFCRIFYHA